MGPSIFSSYSFLLRFFQDRQRVFQKVLELTNDNPSPNENFQVEKKQELDCTEIEESVLTERSLSNSEDMSMDISLEDSFECDGNEYQE